MAHHRGAATTPPANSLKWFRRVATRYEKLATHYLAMVTLAIIFRLLG
jgi:hypothetical protein